MYIPVTQFGYFGTEPVLKNWLTIEGSAKTHNHTRTALQERKRANEEMTCESFTITDLSIFAALAMLRLTPARVISSGRHLNNGGPCPFQERVSNEHAAIRA
jgi:hypothetical protein